MFGDPIEESAIGEWAGAEGDDEHALNFDRRMALNRVFLESMLWMCTQRQLSRSTLVPMASNIATSETTNYTRWTRPNIP